MAKTIDDMKAELVALRAENRDLRAFVLDTWDSTDYAQSVAGDLISKYNITADESDDDVFEGLDSMIKQGHIIGEHLLSDLESAGLIDLSGLRKLADEHNITADESEPDE